MATAFTMAVSPLLSNPIPAGAAIDGHLDEWSSLEIVKERVAVGVANDRARLHVALRIANAEIALRMRVAGAVVYFDPEGKARKSVGIRLPPLGRPTPASGLPSPLVAYLEVVGAHPAVSRIVEIADQGGDTGLPTAAVAEQAGILAIELAVPLVNVESWWPLLASAPGQGLLGVGIETLDPPRTQKADSGLTGLPGPPPALNGDAFKWWSKIRLAEVK